MPQEIEINSILKDLGLSEKEVIIYLALLQLGEETASRISEVADLNRVTTYSLLKSLQEKGFCSIYEKNKVQYFKPIKPEYILGLIEEKKNKIKTILPLLKKQERKIGEKPEISLFEGKKGIVSLLDIIIQSADKDKQVLAYGNFTQAEKIMKYESLHWRKMRLSKKIKIKGVIDSCEKKLLQYIKTKQYKDITEVKFVQELAKANCYTMITSELVAYITGDKEILGILIKNKNVVKKEKLNFEILWKKAKGKYKTKL
jgi:sugar-specific transcriptional regulator TrmB